MNKLELCDHTDDKTKGAAHIYNLPKLGILSMWAPVEEVCLMVYPPELLETHFMHYWTGLKDYQNLAFFF